MHNTNSRATISTSYTLRSVSYKMILRFNRNSNCILKKDAFELFMY